MDMDNIRKSSGRTHSQDLMEKHNISPWISVGKILPTSTKPKEDVFESYRPTKQCVDYNISETWIKMHANDVKINVKQTSAIYEDIPPEICKPERKKKIKKFSGCPPQYKYVDEIYREKVERNQRKIKKHVKKRCRQMHKERTRRFDNDHNIVIEKYAGPDWFMELNPNQLAAVDRLRKALNLDLRHYTTYNCEEILHILGVVVKSLQMHIGRTIPHSCGDPVEFLLVLYQLIDPKRKSYSLNDRLLLSACVHLAIRGMLKELHVRMPSPPKIPENEHRPIKKPDQKKYSSPYLEPQTYQPPTPKFSGVYKNKHRQYPESPYFSYLASFRQEQKITTQFCFNYKMFGHNPEVLVRWKEYKDAQFFYESLPGVSQKLLWLIEPHVRRPCYNMLNPRKQRLVNPKLVAPHLCRVATSEPVLCFCEKNDDAKKKAFSPKKQKKNSCEKNAQDYLNSICTCDDCIEDVRHKTLVRVHGGFQKSVCNCDVPVPIIQGTIENKACECYREYRNKIVACDARQRLTDQVLTYVVGEVFISKFGPIYTIVGVRGPKICLCSELIEHKTQVKKVKETLLKTEVKFVVGGVTMTRLGPVYNLSSVVARRPCKCLVKHWQQVEVLEIQNRMRNQPVSFVNQGLIVGKSGPIFQISNVIDNGQKDSPELTMRSVCSCELKKSKCFEHCRAYFEYKVDSHVPVESSSEESSSESESESQEESSSEQSQPSSKESGGVQEHSCPHCLAYAKKENQKTQRSCSPTPVKNTPCKKRSETVIRNARSSTISNSTTSSSTTSSSTTSSTTEENPPGNTPLSSSSSLQKEESSVDKKSEFDAPKPPCQCKCELERFMNSKCKCEECNRIIRQGYATYVVGGTKETASGNQVNVVQGIHQPQCGCLLAYRKHLEQMQDYKKRVKARYDLKKQPKKYFIAGVTQTQHGPVYNIGGIRPPVECECAKALREKEEMEIAEKQRAKAPKTGRIKYEISGVKAMPNENVYILSRALKVSPCDCEKLLDKFETAHKNCMQELDNYMTQMETEKTQFDTDCSVQPRKGVRNVNYAYSRAYENYPSDKRMCQDDQEKDQSICDIPEEVEPKFTEEENTENQEDPAESINVDEYTENSLAPEEKKDRDEKTEHQNDVGDATSKDPHCTCIDSGDSSSEEEDTLSSEEESLSETSSDDDTSSEGQSCCHVENPICVKPITLPRDAMLPDQFLSKRFAIFRQWPKSKKKLLEIIKHLLEGMAEDGYRLAKLPQVHKLPIFRLWIDLRRGGFWTYEDKLNTSSKSKYLWRHTDVCFKVPRPPLMPYTIEEAQRVTWKDAGTVRRIATHKRNWFYRNLKHTIVDGGREFFATTFSYEFPTTTWRDCAFAYLPTKEDSMFPYKIYKPHEVRTIPENKRTHCYC